MLKARIVSAALLAPPVLLLFYLGTPYTELLVLAAALVMAWEWARLCGAEDSRLVVVAVVGAVLAVVGAGALGAYALSLSLVLGLAAALALALRPVGAGNPLWLAAGVPYIGLPCLAMIWLRAAHDAGALLVIWLVLVIWATDSGAYFAGKTIGGPRLAPRVSPNKTWAGLIGGVAAAALVALVGKLLLPGHPLWPLLLAGGLIAALSQAGDLFESFAKRHFGVKDSGRLIPGHGGLLDRVDGLMVGAVVLAGLVYWREVPT